MPPDSPLLPIHIRTQDIAHEPTKHGNLKQVLLKSGVLPQVTQIAVATYDSPLVETEIHSHPTMFEIYYSLEGAAVYTVAGQPYTIRPGDFLVIPPATLHTQKVVEAPHKVFYWGIATD